MHHFHFSCASFVERHIQDWTKKWCGSSRFGWIGSAYCRTNNLHETRLISAQMLTARLAEILTRPEPCSFTFNRTISSREHHIPPPPFKSRRKPVACIHLLELEINTSQPQTCVLYCLLTNWTGGICAIFSLTRKHYKQIIEKLSFLGSMCL